MGYCTKLFFGIIFSLIFFNSHDVKAQIIENCDNIQHFEELIGLNNCLVIDSVSNNQNPTDSVFSLFISPLGFVREIEVFIENNDTLCYVDDIVFLECFKSNIDELCSNDNFSLGNLLSKAKNLKKIEFYSKDKNSIYQYSGEYYDLITKSKHQQFFVKMGVYNIGTNISVFSNNMKISYKATTNEVKEKIGYFNAGLLIRFSSTYNLENDYDFEQFRIIYYSPLKLKVVRDNVVSY